MSCELEEDINDSWSNNITDDDIMRMKQQIRPMPFPADMAPTCGRPLAEMSDHTLLNAPPHVLAHILRTASQGGLQVISPRQVPFTYLMRRVTGATKNIGDHIVGSIARENTKWPTLFDDEEEIDRLLPDEPLPTAEAERAHRAKTRSISLTTTTYEMTDPILACLVRGRAVIDILRREDVQGDADTFSEILAAAWGISKKDIDDLDAYSLGVEGELLRHAIKADEVYATIYAPIHIRRCISVGCQEISRAYLPEDSAMDWRRMRVFCEAVFAMSVALEGMPLPQMTAIPAPGDIAAAGNRSGVMCFQPSPAICWTFEGSSFALAPVKAIQTIRASAIPREVLAALTRYVNTVKPMSQMVGKGYKVGARRSVTDPVNMPSGETITSAYRLLVQHMAVGAARGKIAASTLRNFLYMTLEQAPLATRLRVVRYLRIAREEAVTHLGVKDVPDDMIVNIANRFLQLGSLIRAKVTAEAARRGSSVEKWWVDILAQAPDRYEVFTEGSKGWSVIAFWLLFKAPTKKWDALGSAMHFSGLRAAELSSVGTANLPPEKGSPERLQAAARVAVKKVTQAYWGYYTGVADVALAVADEADRMKKTRTAQLMREASYLWSFRARCLTGTNVEVREKGIGARSDNHMVIPGPKVNLVLVPAPYRAFAAYQAHVEISPILPKDYKKHIAKDWDPPISKVFTSWGRQIYNMTETTATRYMVRPQRLGQDLERAWADLGQDLRDIMRQFGEPYHPPPARDLNPPAKAPRVEHTDLGVHMPDMANVSTSIPVGKTMGFYDAIGWLMQEQNDWIDDSLEKLGPEIDDEFRSGTYNSPDEILIKLLALMEEKFPGEVGPVESVH